LGFFILLFFSLLRVFFSPLRFFLLLRRQRNRRGRSQPRNLHVLFLHHLQQLELQGGTGVLRGQHICRRPFRLRLLHRPLRLQIKVVQEHALVFVEVVQRNQQSRFFVVVVVALRPQHFRQRRILLVPCARVFLGIEGAFQRVGTAIAKGLIQAADAVVQSGDK